jgi:hypothetical protein
VVVGFSDGAAFFLPKVLCKGGDLCAVDRVGSAPGDTAVAGAGDFAVAGGGIAERVVDLFFGGDFRIGGVSASFYSGTAVIGNGKATNEWAKCHVEDSDAARLADVMRGAPVVSAVSAESEPIPWARPEFLSTSGEERP